MGSSMTYIIFDCDPTLFYPDLDVDDSLALGYAFRKFQSKVELIGVTTVFGNNSADLTYRDARRLVEVAGLDLPVLKGAESRFQLGQSTPSAEFIMKTAREYGEIELLATGPLTNIATAIMLDEALIDAVRRITIMGGAVFVPGNIKYADAEFNFWSDPQAAKMVIEKMRKIVLVPLDVTTTVRWTEETLEPLKASEDKLARFLFEAALPWARNWPRGFHPHDVLAAVYILRPDIYEAEEVKIGVETAEPRQGKVTLNKEGKQILMLRKADSSKLLVEYYSAFGIE